MTLNVDLDLDPWKANTDICANFHENRTRTLREITASVTNE